MSEAAPRHAAQCVWTTVSYLIVSYHLTRSLGSVIVGAYKHHPIDVICHSIQFTQPSSQESSSLFSKSVILLAPSHLIPSHQ